MLLNTARLNQTFSIFFWSKHIQCASLNKIQLFYRIITSYLCRTTTVCCNALAGSYRSILHGALGRTHDLRTSKCWILLLDISDISVISGWVVWLRDFLLISSYFPFSGWALYRTFLGMWTVPNVFRASPSSPVASLLALAVVALRSATWWKSQRVGSRDLSTLWNLWISRQSTDSWWFIYWIPICRSTNSQQAIYQELSTKTSWSIFHDVLMINTLCTKNPILWLPDGFPIARPLSCERPMWPFPCKSQAREVLLW